MPALFSAQPTNKVIRSYAIIWVFVYWAIYFVFRSLFPDKILVDATEIQDIIEGARQGATGSYYMMASLYSMLPFAVTNTIVGLFNGWVLYCIISSARTYLGALLLTPVVAPFIFSNLQAPTKETLVLAMTMLVVHFVSRLRSETKAVWFILIVYALYAGLVREYYAIILAAFVFLVATCKTQFPLRLVFPVLAIVGLMFVPDFVFQSVQGARDEVNFWAITGGANNPIRTLFFNPFPPNNLVNFLGNYGYAFALLNFPFFFFFSPKEFLMFYNILFYGWLAYWGLRYMRGPLWYLPLLFVSHIATLILFEPDLGSYHRHFSSAIMYLIPVFTLFEERRILMAARKTQETESRV